MDFDNMLLEAAGKGAYVSQYTLIAKPRVHISKEKLDENSNVFYIKTGESKSIEYDQALPRYIAAPNVTFDVAISVFDVNSRSIFVSRSFGIGNAELKGIGEFAKGLMHRKPRLEMRVIGMQNKQDGSVLSWLAKIAKSNRISVVEADMFGANIRHIAFDSKLGVSHNILMEDRLYRPGELVNQNTIEMFERSLAKAGQTGK